MSVLASKRDISFHEFRKKFVEFKTEIYNLYEKLPKRKMQYIDSTDLFQLIDRCTIMIVKVDKMMFLKNKDEDSYYKMVDETIELLNTIPSRLYSLFILSRNLTPKKVKQMKDVLNQTCNLLTRIKKVEDYEISNLILFDKSKIKGVKFLERSLELVNTTYTHVTHLPNSQRGIYRYPMYNAATSILSCLYGANMIFPNTIEDFDKRNELFKEALVYINYYDNLLLELLMIKRDYPNDIVRHWTNLLLEIYKMTNGLIESDKTRKKHLK